MHAFDLPLFELKPALLLWEAFVAAALVGYGWGTLRLLREERQPLGIALCTGVGVWLFLGGWLNLFRLAYRPVLLLLLLAGLALFAAELARSEVRARLRAARPVLGTWSRLQRLSAGVIVCYLLLCVLAHLGTFTWNRFDDVQAYMPFAQQAAALGATNSQPFSERRITSGVGGSAFLGTTMLAGPGSPSLQILGMDFLDGSFGFTALLLCIFAATREFQLSRWRTIAVFAAAALFAYGRVNLTAIHLSAAMFLAVLLLLWRSPSLQDVPKPRAVLIGVLLAAAFALKSSNIPFSVVLLGLLFATELLRSRSTRPLGVLAWMCGGALVTFFPWALKHYFDEATALFPSLGRGYHLSAYGFPTIAQTAPALVSVLACFWDLMLPALAAILGALLLRTLPRLRAAPLLAFFAAAAITAPMFSISIAAENIDRFLLPMVNLCALLFLMILLAATAVARPSRWLAPALAVLTFWVILFLHNAKREGFVREPLDVLLLFTPRGLHHKLLGYEELLFPSDVAAGGQQVQRAQNAVPPGATILENIEPAYGFDWKRNPILLADYPGMASLPPGLPLDSTPEATRRYLLGVGIHYVMVDRTIMFQTDYWQFRRHPRGALRWQNMLDVWNPPGVGTYSFMEFYVSNRTRDLFVGIAKKHPAIYDDGRLEVIDLDDPR